MALTFFNQLSVAPYMTTLVTLALSSLGFSILYYATPLKKVRFINAFKAGVMATLGLEIIKYALFVYIQYFSVYELKLIKKCQRHHQRTHKQRSTNKNWPNKQNQQIRHQTLHPMTTMLITPN
jgi:Ca2+/H+ antiporter